MSGGLSPKLLVIGAFSGIEKENPPQTTPCEEEEQEQQSSERKLQAGYCYNTNLNPGQQLFYCMYSANSYSYCASPTGNSRLTKDKTAADLNGALTLDEQAMEPIYRMVNALWFSGNWPEYYNNVQVPIGKIFIASLWLYLPHKASAMIMLGPA